MEFIQISMIKFCCVLKFLERKYFKSPNSPLLKNHYGQYDKGNAVSMNNSYVMLLINNDLILQPEGGSGGQKDKKCSHTFKCMAAINHLRCSVDLN